MFEFFKDKKGEERFRVKGANGEIVATSEGYTRLADARRGADTLRRLAMPTLMTPSVPVLDHGHVMLRNLAGPTRRPWLPFDATDTDPPQAARMSFDQMDSMRSGEQDHGLARYLMKNWHTSPFEMVQVWLDKKMPIFVARHFVRHRTVRLNEVSARYMTLPEEWYIPEVVGGKAPNVKQGQADNLDAGTQAWFRTELNADCARGYRLYQRALERGVANEVARSFLHVNHYTHWLWNQDLHNLFHLLRLRDHGHAQIEAQAYAKAIDGLVRTYLPKSFALYDEYRRQKDPVDLDMLLNEFRLGEHELGSASRQKLLNEITAKLREAGIG